MNLHDKKFLSCPDCHQKVEKNKVKDHVLTCNSYRKKYLTSISRVIDLTSKNNLQFLFAQLGILQQKMGNLFSDSQNQQDNHNQLKKQYKETNKMSQSNQREKIQEKNDEGYHIDRSEVKIRKNHQKTKSLSSKKQINQRQISYLESVLSQNTHISHMSGNKQVSLNKESNQNEKDMLSCSKCAKKFSINEYEEYVYADLCLHPLCKKCILTYLDREYIKATGQYKYPCPYPDCGQQIPYYQLEQIVGKKRMEDLEQEMISGFMVNLTECVKCKSRYQFFKGKPSDAPKVNFQGMKLDSKYQEDFAEYRFLCSNCKTQQCRQCKQTPYHLGKTCQQQKIAKTQKKCRYCNLILPLGYMSANGIKAFDDICQNQECFQKAKFACSKIKKCGHSCFGYIKEKQCLPCLKSDCAKLFSKELNGQNQDSFCNICWTEGLGNAPCIKIKCGHIFHYHCIATKLKKRWFGPRILFNFCHCPLCKEWIDVNNDSQFKKDLDKYKNLENEVKEKALKRLKYQNEEKNDKITDPSSPYYKNQQKYALAIYAYFECFKCKQPYFGGRKSCADAMNQNKQGEGQFKAEDLVCPQCCPISVNSCNKHEKQYISFKCKFCCSIAQWFCWGSTHFCDACHKRQIAGEYLNKIERQKLPKCLGPGKCPIGGNHNGNGQTRSLGCSLCVNLQSTNINF